MIQRWRANRTVTSILLRTKHLTITHPRNKHVGIGQAWWSVTQESGSCQTLNIVRTQTAVIALFLCQQYSFRHAQSIPLCVPWPLPTPSNSPSKNCIMPNVRRLEMGSLTRYSKLFLFFWSLLITKNGSKGSSMYYKDAKSPKEALIYGERWFNQFFSDAKAASMHLRSLKEVPPADGA